MSNRSADDRCQSAGVDTVTADQLIAASQSSDIFFRAPDGTFLASVDVTKCGGLPERTHVFSADLEIDLPSGRAMLFRKVDMRCEAPKTPNSERRIYFSAPNTYDIHRDDYVGARIVLKNFAAASAGSKFHNFSISI